MSFVFLCAAPFLAGPFVALRPLRTSPFHHVIGAALFAAIGLAAWVLIQRAARVGADSARHQTVSGGLLLVPWSLIALLWVGLGTPWDSTASENVMRYVVLLGATVAITAGFVALSFALSGTGERLFSALGLGVGLMAGSAYLIWLAFQVGAWSARVRTGEAPAAYMSLNDALDTLLFSACALTYISTAAFAASFGAAQWMRRGASHIFVVLNLIAFGFIIARGLSFPDPMATSTPWYMRPGFIAGIPAMPWIFPHLLGAILLRYAANGKP